MRRSRSQHSECEAFAAAHGDELIRLVHAMCGDWGAAEDAVQEALTRVFQRWSKLSDPLAYARRTAINATRDDRRRSMRTDRAYREAARLPSRDTDEPHERLLTHAALMEALQGLPHGQRAVIVLRYGSQLSEAETAATLEITVGTVKSQTARALARMRAALSPAEPANHELELA